MGGVVTVSEIPTWFRQQMSRLMGLRFAPADLTTHWEGLQGMPADVLMAAVSRAQRTRTEFPTPAELRMDGDAERRVVPVPSVEEDERATKLDDPVVLGTLPSGYVVRVAYAWRDYCDDCHDSGWATAQLGSKTVGGETVREGMQPTVRRCACWASNPHLVKKRAAEAKYAEAKAKS